MTNLLDVGNEFEKKGYCAKFTKQQCNNGPRHRSGCQILLKFLSQRVGR